MESGGKKLLRLENVESCWLILEQKSIEEFVKLFCNETLTKVYRLLIFSSELDHLNNLFLNKLQKAIERESIKRKFNCFQLVKQSNEDVLDVIYCNKKIIYINE